MNHFLENPYGPSIFILNLHHSFKKQNPKTLSFHHQLLPSTNPPPAQPLFPFLFFLFYFLYFPFSHPSPIVALSPPPIFPISFLLLNFFPLILHFIFFLYLTIPMPTLSNDHLTANNNSSMTADRKPTIISFPLSFYLFLLWKKKWHVVNSLVHYKLASSLDSLVWGQFNSSLTQKGRPNLKGHRPTIGPSGLVFKTMVWSPYGTTI